MIALLLLGAGVARADKKSNAEAAQRLYEEGTKYYSIGDFTKAVESYKQAFQLSPDPVLLYNIGQSYRLAGNFEQSLFFYRSFLRNLPTAPNREEVENRITQVETALAKQLATAEPPNGPVAPSGDRIATTTPPPTPATTKLPGPDQAAAVSAAGTENHTPPAPGRIDPPVDNGGKRPIYKKWWFWAGISAVAVGTVVIVAASSGGSSRPPGTHFGGTDVF